MEVCMKCQQPVLNFLMRDGVCVLCETPKQDTIETLRARIAELELELQRQKALSEQGDQLLKVMWGDNFSTESLH